MSAPLADVAITGFAAASSYDLYRPSYPAKAVQQLLARLNIAGGQGARILDLAAGTGKFTQLLAEREERFEIVAVEPHEGMRSELEKKGLRNVTVIEGDARRVPLEDGSVDAVIVAQAFHWFAHDDAVKEFHRVLVPGGALGLIWNVEDCLLNLANANQCADWDADNSPQSWKATTTWETKMREVTWSVEDEHPRFRHEKWREVFDKQLSKNPLSILTAQPLFSLPIGEDSVRWSIWLSRDDIWQRFHTLSQISNLEGQQLENAKVKVFEAMDEATDTERNEKGELELHGQTLFCWTSAIPTGS